MSDDIELDEGSTPSPVTETAAPSEAKPEVVQADKEVNRKSIKDTVRAAVEEHKREPSPKRQAAIAQRSRADDGKLLPKDKDSPADVEPPKGDALAKAETIPTTARVAEPAAASSTAPTAASSTAFKPPPTWSDEAKAAFTSLPPAVQQAAAKREQEVEQGFAQYKTRTEDIDRAFGPQRDFQLQQLGKSRGEAINQLFHWHDALSNPATRLQAFRALAQSHGIDPSTLAPQQSGQPQQSDPNDPRAYIEQIIQSRLQQSLQPVLQQVGSVGQELQQERMSKAQSELTSFSADKPHFEKVRGAMAQMISSGYATNLSDAYQKATWADPEIRDSILAEQNAKREADAKAAQEAAQAKAAQAEEDRKRKEREAADKARRANIGVRHSTAAGSPSKTNAGKSIRESIVDAVRDARA